VGGSCDRDGGKAAQESNDRIHKREGPEGWWLDTVDRDAKRMLKRRILRMSAEDRDAWSRRIEEARAQAGL